MIVKSVIGLDQDFLSNRNQIVHANDTVSDHSLVTCGVPLLFLCCINDMGFSIRSEIKLLLNADDSANPYSHNNLWKQIISYIIHWLSS